MGDADAALERILTGHHLAVLATLRRNGRPQISVVSYAYDPGTRTARVSVTADRAKTRNLTRDPRATLQVMGESPWVYVVADCDAELGPMTTSPDDPGSDELVALYRAVQGEHPDWAEFRQAMVDERRQVLRLTVTHLYGQAG